MHPSTSTSQVHNAVNRNVSTKRRPVPQPQVVSPPDSPRDFGNSTATSGNVSPIDDGYNFTNVHPAYRGQAQLQSQIPVAKRGPSGYSAIPVANRAYKRDLSAPLKWDKYTGEPTTSHKGIPSNVEPNRVVKGLESTHSKSVVGDYYDDEATLIESRPAWKGASGRSPFMLPVQTRPNQTPFPALNSLTKSGLPTPPQSMSPTTDGNTSLNEAETRSVSEARTRQGSIETNDPTNSSVMNRSVNSSMATTPTMTGYYHSSLSEGDSPRTPPTSKGNEMPVDSSPSSANTVRTHGINRGDSKNKIPNSESRFSWTTLNTNTTYQHSPPPSPPPPLPTNMAIHNHPGSIINRTRPVPSNRNYSPGYTSPIVPDAPPFQSYRAISAQIKRPESTEGQYPKRTDSIGAKSDGSFRAPSIISTSFGAKALPPTPQELNSTDHASQLEAQLADLRLQRSNIERVLRDMTRPSATHALTTNFLVEREREKRVAALRDELHSIGMMEHALGLQLHRVNRRREKEEGYEGFATMWVRRATGLTTDP